MPVVYVHGEHDPRQPIEYCRGMEDHVPGLEAILVLDSGHFVTRERPEQDQGRKSAPRGWISPARGRLCSAILAKPEIVRGITTIGCPEVVVAAKSHCEMMSRRVSGHSRVATRQC